MRRFLLPIALAGFASTAHAATFTDSGSFFADVTPVYTETFSSLGTVTDNSLTGPVSLPSGLTVASQSGDLFVAGPGQSTNPTTAIGSNNPRGDSLQLDFGGTYTAFGTDIFQNNSQGSQTGGPVEFVIAVFLGLSLVDSFSGLIAPNGGGFLGLTTLTGFDNATVTATGEDLYEVIDNVTVGQPVAPIPLPFSGVLLLGGLGALTVLRRRT